MILLQLYSCIIEQYYGNNLKDGENYELLVFDSSSVFADEAEDIADAVPAARDCSAPTFAFFFLYFGIIWNRIARSSTSQR